MYQTAIQIYAAMFLQIEPEYWQRWRFFCPTVCILCLTLCHTCTPAGKGLCDRQWDKVRIGKTIDYGYLCIYEGFREHSLTSRKNVVRFSYLAIRAIKVMERGRNPGRFYGADRTCKTKEGVCFFGRKFQRGGMRWEGKGKTRRQDSPIPSA